MMVKYIVYLINISNQSISCLLDITLSENASGSANVDFLRCYSVITITWVALIKAVASTPFFNPKFSADFVATMATTSNPSGTSMVTSELTGPFTMDLTFPRNTFCL